MGFILTGSSDVRCPHGSKMSWSPMQAPTHYIDDYPVWVKDDKYYFEACPIRNCCSFVSWSNASPNLTMNDSPVLTSDSIGSCWGSESGQIGRVEIRSHQTNETDDD